MQAGVDQLDQTDRGSEAFYVREYQAVVRLATPCPGAGWPPRTSPGTRSCVPSGTGTTSASRQPGSAKEVTVRRAGRTVHRRVLEAAVARLLAGRGPAVAELPEAGRPGVAGRQGLHPGASHE